MRWRWPRRLLVAAALILIYARAAADTGFGSARFGETRHMLTFVRGMWPPAWDILWPKAALAALETVEIALMGTTLALLAGLPLALLAARNVTPWPGLGGALRAVMAFLRGVPEFLWALLFVVALDIGNLPGVLALAVHNTGIFGKILGEFVEAADRGPVEAVAATGAPGPVVVWFGILPQVRPNLVTYALYRFECNVRAATLLGLVGAGGIGTQLMISFKLFLYQELLAWVLAVLALVWLAEALGYYLRRAVM